MECPDCEGEGMRLYMCDSPYCDPPGCNYESCTRCMGSGEIEPKETPER